MCVAAALNCVAVIRRSNVSEALYSLVECVSPTSIIVSRTTIIVSLDRFIGEAFCQTLLVACSVWWLHLIVWPSSGALMF